MIIFVAVVRKIKNWYQWHGLQRSWWARRAYNKLSLSSQWDDPLGQPILRHFVSIAHVPWIPSWRYGGIVGSTQTSTPVEVWVASNRVTLCTRQVERRALTIEGKKRREWFKGFPVAPPDLSHESSAVPTRRSFSSLRYCGN